jgi:hypothetical protein
MATIPKEKKWGWRNKLKPEDQRVQVYWYVKRKYWAQAQKEIRELLKKYR